MSFWFILWGPGISVPNFRAMQSIFVVTLHSGPKQYNSRLTLLSPEPSCSWGVLARTHSPRLYVKVIVVYMKVKTINRTPERPVRQSGWPPGWASSPPRHGQGEAWCRTCPASSPPPGGGCPSLPEGHLYRKIFFGGGLLMLWSESIQYKTETSEQGFSFYLYLCFLCNLMILWSIYSWLGTYCLISKWWQSSSSS